MTCSKCSHSNPPHQLFCQCCQQVLYRAKLRVVEHTGKERYLELNGLEFTIGREAENDLVLGDEAVSRHHARLRMVAGAYLVEDLRSKNGVYVNGQKVQAHQLVSLDCLQIGATHIYYMLHQHACFAAIGGRESSSTGKAVQFMSSRTALSHHMNAESILEQVLHRVLIGVLHLAQAERATIWMPDAMGDLIPRWHVNEVEATAITAGDKSPDLAGQQSLALKIFRSGAAVLREHLEATETFWDELDATTEISYQQLGIAMRQVYGEQEPREMVASQSPIGVLILECTVTPRRLSPARLSRLQSLLAQAGKSLSAAQLVESFLRELDANVLEASVAARIQECLLPVIIPRFAGYDVACWYHPAGAVNGDYLDLVRLQSGELLLALGDVAGKDLTAALVLFAMQACLHLALYYETRLESLLEDLNRLVHAISAPSTFATLFLGVLNPQHRTLRYVNAGHTPGLFVLSYNATPKVEFLHSSCAALGVMDNMNVAAKQLLLPPASALVLFTDGLTEAVNDNGEQYGLIRLTERTVATIMAAPQCSAAHVLESLRADLTLYAADFHGKLRHYDDQAALVMMVR